MVERRMGGLLLHSRWAGRAYGVNWSPRLVVCPPPKPTPTRAARAHHASSYDSTTTSRESETKQASFQRYRCPPRFNIHKFQRA
jgi:hypothetical protein